MVSAYIHLSGRLESPNITIVLFVDVAIGKKLTFNQIRASGEQFGKGLQEQWRWCKGDVLATVSPNTIDLVPATFGALRVGGVICPLNFLYTVDELVSQLTSSKAKGLITSSACLEVVREAASKIGLPLDRILLVGDVDPENNVPHFSSLRGSPEATERVSINPKEDLAYLVYSSGTTGLPKGVMLTHSNIVANSIQIAAAEGPDITHWRKDRSLGFLPMYHIYGTSGYIVSKLTANSTRRRRPDAVATPPRRHHVHHARLQPPGILQSHRAGGHYSRIHCPARRTRFGQSSRRLQFQFILAPLYALFCRPNLEGNHRRRERQARRPNTPRLRSL